jgi:small subunit ribosomal protein S27e
MAGNFYAVECPDCENEQVVFGKAASEASCAVCGHTLARPTGGMATIEGEIVETVEAR